MKGNGHLFMANEKTIHFANFNITFGEKEDPMLTHFEDVIFPAFISEHKRAKNDEGPAFYFDEVKIKEIDKEYVLVGNYIKDTQYNVRTTVQDGKLVSSPSAVPTAPYSRFIIFLKNHRMVLIRNESMSPGIQSFQSTVRDILNKYIRAYNRKIGNGKEKLPNAIVNIVDIPLKDDIETVLSDVSKIKWIRFRFFPLNNDFSLNPFALNINEEMKQLGSDTAFMQFNSPDSITEINSVIERTAGLARARLEVIDKEGNKKILKEGSFSSNKKIAFTKDIKDEDDEYFLNQAKKDSIITYTSEPNKTLYEQFKHVITSLLG